MISNIHNRLKTKPHKIYVPTFKGKPLSLPFFQLWQYANKTYIATKEGIYKK